MALDPGALERLLARRGPLPAREVLDALGVSQPSLSRLAASSPRVRRIGRTRASHYALARDVRSFGTDWPVYRISPSGKVRAGARLHALSPDRWWYETQAPAAPLLHGHPQGLFDDWPWFLEDLRPQGFLGRVFARRRAGELGLADDPSVWLADGVLVAMLAFGDDTPGNFVIGGDSVQRVQKKSLEAIEGVPFRKRRERYSELAEAVLAGTPVGSSAGGEQPKFASRLIEANGVRDVIVKLSPPRNTDTGRRWADLLLAEHLAAEQLSMHGLAASKTEWVEGTSRAFLEVTRFDRVGEHGRVGVVSLLALDAEFYGLLDTWPRAAERLLRGGWISPSDAERLEILWWFGKLILNSDLHFGNVSLFLDERRPLALAPAYDMLPMGLAPRGQGEIISFPAIVEPPPPESVDTWRRAAVIAVDFWQALSADRRVSRALADQANEYTSVVRRLLDKFG